MSSESPIPRTLAYARHIGRELALLCLSSLSQTASEADFEALDLADLIERATRMLNQEAEEYLNTSGKALEAVYSQLEQLDPSELLDDDNIRDLGAAKRQFKSAFDKIKDNLRSQTEQLSHAVNLLGESLHIPLMRILADNPHVRTFTLALVGVYCEQRETIDTQLNAVAEDWSVERMNSIDRDLLRIAATEMLFDPMANRLGGDRTPLPVIINEAVELAKKYGTPDSFRFVNAILRNLLPHAEARRQGQETA
ncbi:MAG: transcription antitermination factor NusB [Candidatus Sericytochromatia bacterium]|nr:transcription antitermination factor NusB [Candidatus Sericytochromatia bacterium]